MGVVSWSDMAEWYDALVRGGSGPHETAGESLRRLLPDVDGARVIDVACGQGLATRLLAAAGAASVVGVDSSPEMVDLARRHEPVLGYVVDDAQTLATFGDDSFDGAAAHRLPPRSCGRTTPVAAPRAATAALRRGPHLLRRAGP